MLREGRIADALPAARKLYADEPGNVWNLRALVRALCKSIGESNESAEQQKLAVELGALPALPPGDDDAKLTEYRERSLQRADPLSQRLWAIRDASKNGAHEDALRQLRQIHREHPQRTDVDESLAWELWFGIVEALKSEEPDKGCIRNLLLEYRSLRVTKPSVIHSRILDVAARAAHDDAFPTFCGFLQWWDPANLRDEDFQANPGNDGKSFPSVVEHAIQGLGKALKSEANPELIRLAGAFIEQHYQRYPEQEKWFPYYLARAWIKNARTDDAKMLLMPVVRRNQNQPWAWRQLAACFQETEPDCVACLCRALLCPGQEAQFLVTGVPLAVKETW
jgi:predicted Zn-dependent protease